MMLLLFSAPSVIPSLHINPLKCKSPFKSNFTFVQCNILKGCPSFCTNPHPTFSKNKQLSTLRFIATKCTSSDDFLFNVDSSITFDWTDQKEEVEDMESPWEGAVVYQRNPLISHVEYCTTLERLGLQKLSTEISRSRSSMMGLRVTKAVKDFPLGTPVLISVDVSRKEQKLRLDGIVRTVITLACHRCGEPTAECVFSNFSLLLTEEPIQEPDDKTMEVIFWEDEHGTCGGSEEEEDDEASIDWEDRLFFPPGEKTIDISKHIRDLVHVEIIIDALCDPLCKGLCFKCGSNLNTTTCNCSEREMEERGYGPLRGLREQMPKN
ncbi:Protein of unknown function DUF177 protein [Actinidia chinensis var. chinensis]|uniref:Uncharacterized protein n=1 Tax=Actinidia chinensis var. chinensis TaxID=1590841 RepID=A0A2R6Q8U4_ACTCC|nr:Protein of unknown function DUF177 protein [Actinidia chinensis var. chinensis]